MKVYDYIIVGAGSAGCVLAHRLTENPAVRVLLVEAGPTTDKFWVNTPAGMAKLYFHKYLNWNYFTEPMHFLEGRSMYWPRGKGLGGSSAINGMVYIRGHAQDFDNWRDMGNPGWGFDDVLPYFKRMEHNERGGNHHRGVGGPLWVSDPVVKHPSSVAFIKAAQAHGIPETLDMNGELHDGVGFMQHTIRNGRRQSAYTAYVAPIRDRANLTILTDCHVQRIVLEGNVATGIEVLHNSEMRAFGAAREVLLAAGALNSPKILMLSGIGAGADLQRHGIECKVDIPGVGRNLQDHFYIHTTYRSVAGSSYNRNITGLFRYMEGLRYLLTRRGYLALGSSQVAAFVKSRAEEAYADLQISFRPMAFTYHGNGVVEVDRNPSIAASVYRLRPRGSGTVTLRSAKPEDAPVCEPNFMTDSEDIAAVISGIRQIRKIMSLEPMASLIVEEVLPGVQAQTDDALFGFMQAHGNSAHHGSGTCKMGNDSLAVVDARLRVHGVERLRVVDASIMPHVTSGNTNAPTIMIGERGSDFIREDSIAPRPIAN